MKNRYFIFAGLLVLTVMFFLSANAGVCVDAVAQHVPALPAGTPVKNDAFQDTLVKFAITMAGVVLSCVLIWGGLTIYNRFFVKTSTRRISPDDDILKTPKTIEEAVTFFIKKNKLN